MIRAYPAAAIQAAEEPVLAATPADALMVQAAGALATTVLRELRALGARRPGSVVLLLVGGGNNGGDALYAGARLARRGLVVLAALCAGTVHERALAAARSAGVEVHPLRSGAELDVPALLTLARRAGVWVDALTGIGAAGGLREPLAGAVRALDDERLASPDEPLVVAVDVPSGIGVDDGALPGPVLPAHVTVTMSAPKPGLLLPPAAALAGRIEVVDLGLDAALAAGAPETAARLTAADAADLWPVPGAADHKYTRGVLGLVAGSARYPGAAVLATSGALGAGVGMLRYLGPPEPAALITARHPETVPGPGRVQAWALGSGIDPADADRAAAVREALAQALAEDLPVVADAGALALLPERLPATTLLTPHAGELAALLRARGHDVDRAQVEAEPLRHLRAAVGATGATVLLKGATTLVAGPHGPVHAQADGTPWLATAGSGDVLTGITGALLAGCAAELRSDTRRGGDLLARLGATAALVHGRAGVRASGGGPAGATNVARAVPGVVRELIEGEP
ncbi:bifunctional ADP-dependent NAD(P)H-hydrate dehydratase/NAD(P)H-hydrate epimerase [Georgenia faecalis]|uniref:bifunctional ADP-dependent NAD(P)H-hydrate dehydratase/NAD(P)H-hydrate epimerase n=1 Tax=Georgenia faecalis TaxID=2483799 RepID=UPI000FDCCD4E|nr:bifunctional ADP-dependent NAD(P)H-hydrate dehydratase/NAD(P)H-hydrate epimerase [Georgenia faecalis]